MTETSLRKSDLIINIFSEGTRTGFKMRRKRRQVAKNSHQAELRHAESIRKTQERKLKNKKPRVRKAKRKILRYRRNMRIDGVIARNKGHAKELFHQKREREMEWEAPEESRPIKRRLVEKTDSASVEPMRISMTSRTDGPERFLLI